MVYETDEAFLQTLTADPPGRKVWSFPWDG